MEERPPIFWQLAKDLGCGWGKIATRRNRESLCRTTGLRRGLMNKPRILLADDHPEMMNVVEQEVGKIASIVGVVRRPAPSRRSSPT